MLAIFPWKCSTKKKHPQHFKRLSRQRTEWASKVRERRGARAGSETTTTTTTMNLTELNASLNRQKGGFDRWAHSRLNAVESIRQKHQVDMKKASEEYEELKENHEK